MQEFIKQVARGKKRAQDLSYEDARRAAEMICSGEADDAQTAALLVAERLKEESPDEAVAFAEVLREHTTHIPVIEEVQARMIDFGGPYTGRNMFAQTIPSALLLAAEGIPVYLHSGEALPPKYAVPLKHIVSDIGIDTGAPPEQIGRSLEEAGIGFGDTEKLCPPLQRIRRVRELIGVRTFLNTIEKMLSPAGARSIMVGIFHRTVVDTNSELLRRLGFDHMYMVQGAEGSEDLPAHRKSFLYHVTQEETISFDLNPDDTGIGIRRNKELETLTLPEQTELIEGVLRGNGHPDAHALTVYNTGVRYFLFGHRPTVDEGIQLAESQLSAGAGWDQLEKWRKIQ
ncbi:anthranilate phosphoribosyltransferase [Alkalicoccus urumqiensis]|uniref:Glycosyl transferase n=1 Tax=Alkalicoccus urumqiensis TaxID=1548213 RepID=A0A2P6MLN9_ALKUR|nr:glycosyl transferase [Alkalicoccus urumqiensis]PRO67205.1 glycosyl transferase [Alkalicoccus urumqiensis]